jgi:membrane protein YdbS with pleckstrin-like domain
MAFHNEPIRIDSIPALPAESFEGLPARYRTLRWLVYAAVMFLALAGLGVLVWFELDAVDEIRWGVWVAVGGVFMAASVWALEEAKGFPIRGVLVREHDLSYRSGFLRRETVTVPFNRIQHSEISQGPVARAFDVCTLKLYTAGNSGANLRVAGMDVERAKRLRERLDERARTA